MIGFLTDPIRPLNIQRQPKLIVRKRQQHNDENVSEHFEETSTESTTTNTYYSKLNSIANGDEDVSVKYDECSLVITPSLKETYTVMGPPATFTYKDHINRIATYGSPNYMKVILNNSELYAGTIFESFQTLATSDRFLASCNIGSSTTKTTTNVAPIDLGTTKNVFIRNVSNTRSYVKNTREQVFGILMERFNSLIDKIITNGWSSEDAANEVVKTFFSVDSTNGIKPYKEFIYTLLLPSMLLSVLNDNEKYKVFYYMGYLPSGSKCVMVENNETYRSIEEVDSVNRPSDYSTMDMNQSSFAALNTDIDDIEQVLDGIKLSCTEVSDPIDMDSDDIVTICSSTGCGSAVDSDGADVSIYKVNVPIYTFPDDMNVYLYLLMANASKFAQQIITVIENSRYLFVAMNRFINTCAKTFYTASDDINYVEPIIGYPVFRSVLKNSDEPYSIGASSSQVGTSTDCRDISYDTSAELNTITKYARDMTVNGGATYEYINASTTLYSLVKYDNVNFGSSLYFVSNTADTSDYTLMLTTDSSRGDNLTSQNTARVAYSVDDEHFTFTYASADTVQYITKNSLSTSNLSQYSISISADNDNTSYKALVIEYKVVETSLPSFLKNAYSTSASEE